MQTSTVTEAPSTRYVTSTATEDITITQISRAPGSTIYETSEEEESNTGYKTVVSTYTAPASPVAPITQCATTVTTSLGGSVSTVISTVTAYGNASTIYATSYKTQVQTVTGQGATTTLTASESCGTGTITVTSYGGGWGSASSPISPATIPSSTPSSSPASPVTLSSSTTSSSPVASPTTSTSAGGWGSQPAGGPPGYTASGW